MKNIELNEQQIEFIKTLLNPIVNYEYADTEFSNTSIAIAKGIINKLDEE